ncbi:MAG: hypothetical protein IJ169_04550 [Paludibacteraceae bacterium]|nr:hypothetical protein [Paludibacteraceae bacterium]
MKTLLQPALRRINLLLGGAIALLGAVGCTPEEPMVKYGVPPSVVLPDTTMQPMYGVQPVTFPEADTPDGE